MNFEVYCDESCPEALVQSNGHPYAAIGSLWLPQNCRSRFKEGFRAIKVKHRVFGELKWKKVSPAYLDLYKEMIDFFFQSDYLRFRVILIEASKVNHIRFNQGDAELGFYKFYYQLLQHWIFDFNTYSIFLDLKTNRVPNRIHTLQEVLSNSNLTSSIQGIQSLPSDQVHGIQLVDILSGAVAAKFNGAINSEAKKQLLSYIEKEYLNHPIKPTGKWEEKFNVFKINLQGGW